MKHTLPALAALTLSVLPLHANTLPQGAFMLGTYALSDLLVPRYMTVVVEDSALTIEVTSPIPLNHLECDTSGDCVYAVTSVTAQIDGDGMSVTLTNVDIAADFPDEIWDDLYPHTAYSGPLLTALHDSTPVETTHGFTLTTAQGPLEFFRVEPDTRDTIQSYAMGLNLSMRLMAGCEVRGIAPLFSRTDLTPGEVQFREVLRGFSHQAALNRESGSLRPFRAEHDPANDLRVQQIMMESMLPNFMTFVPEGPDLEDRVWDEVARNAFREDRAAYDAAIANYGDALRPLSAFIRHMQTLDQSTLADRVCDDLSLGFIAAQDGG